MRLTCGTVLSLAFFGKYLNEYNGSYIPPGWSDWSALVRNSRYYNYTLNVNGDKVRHGANYELDYYPDLILNDSLQYMRYSKRSHSSKPYLMVMSFPSPHGPEDAAPQYQDMFLQEKGHRTPSWNHAPNRDKQWLLRNTHKMAPIHQEFTDFLNAKRLQTLQSIDEAVHQVGNRHFHSYTYHLSVALSDLLRIEESGRTGQHIHHLHLRPWVPPGSVRSGERQSDAIRV